MKCEEKEIIHHWNTESVLSHYSLKISQIKIFKSAKLDTLTFFFYKL